MQPLTIASNNLADDGVSPAGLRQKIDLIANGTTQLLNRENNKVISLNNIRI